MSVFTSVAQPRYFEVTPTVPPVPELAVSVHLLDSTTGHAVRSWTFADRPVLNVGRLEENDIVISDPAVSRLHVTLRFADGAWRLESVGKHGVLIDERRVEAAELPPNTVFRLGARGPTLRFDFVEAVEPQSQQCQTTIEFDSFAVGTLSIDRESAAEQVRQITDDHGFQRLLEQAAELRKRRIESRD